jgi:DNA-binding CsgD family transcriptional regulator
MMGDIKRGEPGMESSQEPHSSVRQRRTKFTPLNIRQIINLVERGTSPAQIAEIIGVTPGTLKTTCSKLHISLRRPSYNTGTGLLRHRRPRAGNGGAMAEALNSPTHANSSNEQPVTVLDRQPMEQEPTLVPEDKATRSHRPLAAFALVMEYKGERHTAKLPLSHDMIGQLAIEAEFRGMKLVELIARAIESIVKEDQFDLVLGQPPKRGEIAAPKNAAL